MTTPIFIAEPVTLGPGIAGHAYAVVLHCPKARRLRLSFAAPGTRHAPRDLLCRLPREVSVALPLGIIPGERWADDALARHLTMSWAD